jgi:hypothetical protein
MIVLKNQRKTASLYGACRFSCKIFFGLFFRTCYSMFVQIATQSLTYLTILPWKQPWVKLRIRQKDA